MARGKASVTILLAVVFAVHRPCFAQKADSNGTQWQTREMLVSRLGAELYKIDVLHRDLANIKTILNDLRDLELFPAQVTTLSDSRLVEFDRTIELFEKRREALGVKVDQFRMPLADALSIMRELVVGQPVEDMFKIIEKGDIDRINEMLHLKHAMDTLRQDMDSFLKTVNQEMGFEPFTASEDIGATQDFFEIVQANLGQQWEHFYNRMETIKDSLAGRASPAQKQDMFRYEHHHLKKIVSEERFQLGKRKIVAMQKRYSSQELHAFTATMAQLHYQLGEYDEVLSIIDNSVFPADQANHALLLRVKSLYALGAYSDIWSLKGSVDFEAIAGKQRNILLWLLMESGLQLDVDEDFSTLARFMDKQAGYNFHVFHALARSYIQRDNYPIALSVFKSATRYTPQRETDRQAYKRILLGIGQAQYEMGEYETALKSFFDLLNEKDIFSEVLFGIVWCYIHMDMYDKAELSLRKLINQNPHSPFSVEAILLMGKRFMKKAQFEWEKTNQLKREEYEISLTLEKLKKSSGHDQHLSKRIQTAQEELQSLLDQIGREKRSNKSDIELLYQNAQNVCRLIGDYYETGSFQQFAFSHKREKLLHTLDSLLLAVDGDGETKDLSFSLSRKKIQHIKQLVRRSQVLSTEISIERYKWEKEYLSWEKEMLLNEKKLLTLRAGTDGQEKEDIVKRIDIQIDSLVSNENNFVSQRQGELVSILHSTIRRIELDTLEDIYLRYHLGELHYARENRQFSRIYEIYEQDFHRYDSLLTLFHDARLEAMPLAPQKPTLDHTNSIALFKEIIQKYGGHHATAPVEYSLGWCYNDLGLLDSAVTHMKQLTSVFPQSSYTPQAWMYIGEYHFDRADLDSASQAYQSVMTYPESKWFDEALYKLAWTNYRQSNPEKAISSFLALIDMEGAGKLGKPLLEKESIDYIAISFSESDPTGDKGLDRAERFVRKYGDDVRGPQILYRLAEVYREQGRYSMAARTFKTLLAMYPTGNKNPHVENGLLAVSERDMSITQTAQAKVDFFRKYNHQSAWAKAQEQKSVIEEADSMSASQLYDAAILFHQFALQDNDSTFYTQAAQVYETYIHYYPQLPQANECHYNYAEILFSMGEYHRATREYIAVSKRYPNSKYRETAAWNAIVSSQLLMKQEEALR